MSKSMRRVHGEEVDDLADDDFSYDTMPSGGERYAREAPYSPFSPPVSSPGCSPTIITLGLIGLGILTVIFLFGTSLQGIIPDPLAQFSSRLQGILAAPTPTIRSNAAVVSRIQKLNRLETTSYSVEKVFEASIQGNAFQNLLFGDRLLLIAHGVVVAGLDLSTLQAQDITISDDGKVITIKLPPVQIFSATLDNSKTRVYDREKGLLATTDKDLETTARQKAEAEILLAACEYDIMQLATTDARRAMEQLLSLLDFERVEIVADPVPPCPEHPLSPTSP
jgi:hypothetical protein